MTATSGPCLQSGCICRQGRFSIGGSPGNYTIGACGLPDCGHPFEIHIQASEAPPTQPGPMICPRDITVARLYQRMLRNRVIHVCGPPAVGKTTLLKLLYHYIQSLHGAQAVLLINGWSDCRAAGSTWKHCVWEQTGVNPRAPVTDGLGAALLVDEAQSSYWDDQFWSECIKGLAQGDWEGRVQYVVLFSVYGGGRDCGGGLGENFTHATLNVAQNVSLVPDIAAGVPVGLLLTEDEFEDALRRKAASFQPPMTYDADCARKLHSVTQGHAGALHSLLDALHHPPDPSSPAILGAGQPLSAKALTLFFADAPNAVQSLSQTPLCRALPPFSSPATALSSAQPLTLCHHKGWVHSYRHRLLDLHPADDTDVAYVFPSRLHEWYTSAMLLRLGPPATPTAAFAFATPLALAQTVVARFKPTQLSAPYRLSPGTLQRPPESNYQDEFYRCCHIATQGQLLVRPGGRSNFFLPTERWGIKLLRNGDRLLEHARRFGLGTQAMDDFIILDFRDTPPQDGYPLMAGKLFHVVFSEHYTCYEMLDAALHTVLDIAIRSVVLIRKGYHLAVRSATVSETNYHVGKVMGSH
ncbi:hypothetical protein DFH27DRAFT_619020 [Peziza echinospora]|nr:hypothetical protein DFH27DRAFT_619020 [Peziza echinospora]